MLRILPCYAVRWKKRLKLVRPRRRKTDWHIVRGPLGRFVCAAAVLIVAAAPSFGPAPSGPVQQAAPRQPAAQLSGTPIERGRVLFVREWAARDDLSPKGDGLGPLYNAKSCAECHKQGGVGGSGKLENNVDLLTVSLSRQKETIDPQILRAEVGTIHPGLVQDGSLRSNITLHKSSTSTGYGPWRGLLLKIIEDRTAAKPPGLMRFQVISRRTPSLFGAGLIDSIPDEVLREVAAQQARHGTAVRGRVAVSSDGGVGKFGWRGQTAKLEQFVVGACANELGLQAPSNDQAINPFEPSKRLRELDLSPQQCVDLTAFVANLPPPSSQTERNQFEQAQWLAGARLFKTAGCAECHRPKLGEVVGVFSDLLLHDMGPDLADPVGANRAHKVTKQQHVGGGYNGGSQDILTETTEVAAEATRHWRTPPLWGVAIGGPYLHDGRASTIDAAIRMHGGEATGARTEYVSLTDTRRQQLITFLESLGDAPRVMETTTW